MPKIMKNDWEQAKLLQRKPCAVFWPTLYINTPIVTNILVEWICNDRIMQVATHNDNNELTNTGLTTRISQKPRWTVNTWPRFDRCSTDVTTERRTSLNCIESIIRNDDSYWSHVILSGSCSKLLHQPSLRVYRPNRNITTISARLITHDQPRTHP